MVSYNKAKALIEQWRYKYNVSDTLMLFVEHWAHLHSGMHKPASAVIEQSEFIDVAVPLTHELTSMMYQGESDPLAFLLSEFCKGSNKHLAYYPSPPEVGTLIFGLLGNDWKLAQGQTISISEPCCGTAGISMQKIEGIAMANSAKDNPLEGVSLHVEDINPIAVHAFFLQLLHKLQYLQSVLGKVVMPDKVVIEQINTLSRKRGQVCYTLTNPNL
jgi:hypothetical protein